MPRAGEAYIRGFAGSVSRSCKERLPQGPGGPAWTLQPCVWPNTRTRRLGFPKASDNSGVGPTSLLMGRGSPVTHVNDTRSDGPSVFAILHAAGRMPGTSRSSFRVLCFYAWACLLRSVRGGGTATGLRPTRSPTFWRDGVDSPEPKGKLPPGHIGGRRTFQIKRFFPEVRGLFFVKSLWYVGWVT